MVSMFFNVMAKHPDYIGGFRLRCVDIKRGVRGVRGIRGI